MTPTQPSWAITRIRELSAEIKNLQVKLDTCQAGLEDYVKTLSEPGEIAEAEQVLAELRP